MSDVRLALKRRGICVIIPTYNNAATVTDVVARTLEFCDDVFVVTDGCTDDTVKKLNDLSENAVVRPEVIVLPKNTGKGNALRTGFHRALQAGFSYAITIDADGQHYPEDIPLFLEANKKYPGAIIVGQRMGLESVERSCGSSFANHFSNFWFFVQTLCLLNDTQTGYRLYPLRRMRGLSLLTSRYEAELELLVFSSWNGIDIRSQAVRVYYPPKEDRVSHFRPGYDFLRISLLNVFLCLLAVVYGLPRKLLRFLLKVLKSVMTILVYVVAMLLITPAVFVYFMCGSDEENKKETLHRFICALMRFAIVRPGLPGVKYNFVNDRDEDFDWPAVIICNHQSHLDLLAIMAMTPKLVILTADWVWHNPLYGYIIRKADFLPASRGVDAILPQLETMKEKGYSIVVYPEGTRSVDCSIGRFHQGAFYLAEKLQLDILPIILYGTGKVLPKHTWLFNRWSVQMEIDERITQDKMHQLGWTLKQQASSMRAYYKSRYSEIADHIEQVLMK